jgi:hypothetical protein
MTLDEWMAYGLAAGWVGPAVCYTHDGLPTTVDEDEEFETGDPCLHILRLYTENYERLAVEFNHAPSEWRKPR